MLWRTLCLYFMNLTRYIEHFIMKLRFVDYDENLKL